MCTLALSDMGELRDEWLRERAAESATKPPGDRPPDATGRAPLPAARSPLPTAAALAIAYLTEAPVTTSR